MLRVVLALVLVVVASMIASGEPTVFVSPAELTVDVGEPFEMSIRADAGYPDSVTAFLVDFTFDPEVVELVSADEGSLFAGCGYPTMYDWDVVGPGVHSCNDVTLGHTAHVFLPGELVALDFVAVAVGETPIQITAADLRDINRDPILPVYTADGFVTVLPVTGIDESDDSGMVGERLRLAPNPSSGSVEIAFAVDQGAADATVSIHDVAGRVVARPGPVAIQGGTGAVTWDGRTASGGVLPSGVYFVVVGTTETEHRSRCVLLR